MDASSLLVTDDVRIAVRRSLAEFRSSTILVGCSGGGDSLALARALAGESRRADVRAVAIVVDHGLQPASGDVARRALDQCRGFGLTAEVVAVNVTPRGEGLEAAARDARYAAFEEAIDRWGADAIMLGHTLDDQAETVLMRLTRGSGARSLAGIPAVSGRIRRPLLHLPRATVRASVADLQTWEDPHNDDMAMLRPRVRHELLPVIREVLGEGAVLGLARTASLMRADADALDAWAEREYAGIAQHSDGVVELGVRDLEALPEAVRTRVIRLACFACGVPGGALTHEHVCTVHALIGDWHGQGAVSLPGPVTAERRYDRLCLRGADRT